MQFSEIVPGVFTCLMDNRTANAGFVETNHGVVVIDTLDTPARGREFAAAIESQTGKPTLFVINTHFHYDHTFGNQAFNAPIVAHCALSNQLASAAAQDLMPVAIAARLSEHPEDRWLADDLELVYPNIMFDQRLLLDLAPMRMVLQHAGGHTLDSSIIDLPEKAVLFAGDLVFEGRVPYLLDAHIGNLIQALVKLEELGNRLVVPGHGELCDLDYVARVRVYLEELLEAVQDLVRRGWEKADILESDRIPRWWTEDRRNLMRMNVERVYNEMVPKY